MAEKAYCVKCRNKRNMVGGKRVTMKNGRNAMKGKCNNCNTKMFKITGGDAKCSGGKSRRRRTNKRKSRKNRTRSRR